MSHHVFSTVCHCVLQALQDSQLDNSVCPAEDSGAFWKKHSTVSSSAGVPLSLKCGLLLRDADSVMDRQGLSLCVPSHEIYTTQGLLKPRHRSGTAPQEIRMRLVVYQTQFRVLISRDSVFPNFLLCFPSNY